MHVCHVVRQFAPMVGGLEDAVAQLSFHLRRQHGITCSVVTLDRPFGFRDQRLPLNDEYLGIEVRRIPFYGSARYPIAPRVLAKLGDADIVHVHGIDFFFDFLSATRVWHRRPLIASTHGGFFHSDFAPAAKRVWFSTITRASAKAYSRIIGSSQSDADAFLKIAPERTIVIENGVNIDKWRNAASVEPLPTIIFIGRFSINKDVPSLIRLVAALGAPWRLIIAGQPSDISAGGLRSIADAEGVSDRTEIYERPSDEDIRAFLMRASYVASASRYEGFGLSVVEGMSAGLTPLLSPIPPFRRLLERAQLGLLIDTGSLADSATAIRTLHNHQTSSTRAANMAAAASFGWTGVAGEFAAEYSKVLDEDLVAPRTLP